MVRLFLLAQDLLSPPHKSRKPGMSVLLGQQYQYLTLLSISCVSAVSSQLFRRVDEYSFRRTRSSSCVVVVFFDEVLALSEEGQ